MNDYWRNCPYSESQQICFDRVNPKRIGTAAFTRYERYKCAQTFREYFEIVKAGPSEDSKYARVDLQNDINKGLCRLESNKTKPVAVELKESKAPTFPTTGPPSEKTETGDASSPRAPDAPKVVLSAAGQTQDASDASVHLGATASSTQTSNQAANGESQDVNISGEGESLKPSKKGPRPGSSKRPAQDAQRKKSPASREKGHRLGNQSLFSQPESGQPKNQLAKRASGKEGKEQKERKVPKEKKDRESAPSKAQPKKKEVTRVLKVRELVRDVVMDYMEGQPDPAEKSVVSDTKKSIKETRSAADPIIASNRNGYIFVADAGGSAYTHDYNIAKPLASDLKNARCDVCGKGCKHERLYRVRCYSRRTDGAASELKDPRVMRHETYHAGSKCLTLLLAPPVVPHRRLEKFRERLLLALEAQGFDDHQWVEPLWRLDDVHSKTFTDLLSAELARVIRARGADEETEKEHNQKKLHEIDSFEDREHYRQLRLNREVVTRCKQLKQRLSLSRMVSSKSSKEEYKNASGNAAVPDVLEDLLLIATHNAVSLSSLGLRPMAPGKTTDFGAASPPEDPKTVSQEATPPGNSVPGQWTMMTPLPAWEPPSASLPAKRKQGEEPWDGTDHLRTTAYDHSGFRRHLLNCTYFADQAMFINGRRTFWDESHSVFMYWQSNAQRWAICQRWQHGQDLLKEVQRGRDLGWAYMRSPGSWREFSENVWHKVSVSTSISQADPLPPAVSLMDQLATLQPQREQRSDPLLLPKPNHVLPGSGRSHPPLTGVETIGVDTPPLIMAMPVEPSADNDFLDICTPTP